MELGVSKITLLCLLYLIASSATTVKVSWTEIIQLAHNYEGRMKIKMDVPIPIVAPDEIDLADSDDDDEFGIRRGKSSFLSTSSSFTQAIDVFANRDSSPCTRANLIRTSRRRSASPIRYTTRRRRSPIHSTINTPPRTAT